MRLNGPMSARRASALAMNLALGGLATGAAMLPAIALNAAPAKSMATAEPILLSTGSSRVVNLPAAMSDVVVADPNIADIVVQGSRQFTILAKGPGQTNVIATGPGGRILYTSAVRVGNNITSIDQMLRLALPEAAINVSTMNGMVLLTGTIKAPEHAAEAERLTQAFVGKDVTVVSRLRTATPLQVNLHVKVAEVSRSLVKDIAANTAVRNLGSGGSLFTFNRNPGRVDITNLTAANSGLPLVDASSLYNLPAGSISLPFDPASGRFITGGTKYNFTNPAEGNIANVAGRLFGLDIATALDLAETQGLVATLAEPNLTALSGETASFLAGGEFPIPISTGLGEVTVQFKRYGVSLAFTPTVLADGRISMRVRPEVSELSSEGSVVLGGIRIPAITTRQLETTVELGSGQSFMLGGLMRNASQSTLSQTPGLGNLPILGNLFKSNGWQKNETELVIIVTPYLVNPVNSSQVALPTDGYLNATDAQRLLLNQMNDGTSKPTPRPQLAPPVTMPANGDPAPGAAAAPALPAPAASADDGKRSKGRKDRKAVASAAPGFSF